ncbi:hypothetical protein AeNC1_011622 [Aphanomyces euteiches]|nr:hypothetical protein AeNC1_011622 [Aphanomyces euteiches]
MTNSTSAKRTKAPSKCSISTIKTSEASTQSSKRAAKPPKSLDKSPKLSTSSQQSSASKSVKSSAKSPKSSEESPSHTAKSPKRPKLADSAWSRLPVEVVVKIAFAIPDPDDLFDFLEALRPYKVLGPLEDLYQLGLAFAHSDLWPLLRIPYVMTKSPKRHWYDNIARYYPKVVVEGKLDVEWLKKIGVQSIELIMTLEWPLVGDWASLTITEFTVSFHGNEPENWTNLLPQMHQLIRLKVSGANEDGINGVCAFAAESNNLIHLEIDFQFWNSPQTAIRNLIKWFNRQPVRVFGGNGMVWGSNQEVALKQQFYKAMFNCPTMDKLLLSSSNLSDVDFSHLTLSMNSLSISRCTPFREDFFLRLGKGLEGSKVTHISVTDSHSYADHCSYIKHLLQSLPRTSIKHLELHDGSIPWKPLLKLFPLLEYCPLEKLTIHIANFTWPLVAKFAKAIQNNKTLRNLNLDGCLIEPDYLRLVIESFTYPSRPVGLKRIQLRPHRKVDSIDIFEGVEEFAEERGCVFDFSDVVYY